MWDRTYRCFSPLLSREITSHVWLPMLCQPISSVCLGPNVMVLKTETSSLGHCESFHFPTRQAQTIHVSPSIELSVWALVPAKSWRRSGHLLSIISATPQSADLLSQLFSWREERLSTSTQLLQAMSPPSIQPHQESPGTSCRASYVSSMRSFISAKTLVRCSGSC